MVTLLGIVLVLCATGAGLIAQTRARAALIGLSTFLLGMGLFITAGVAHGPRDLWLRLPWLPHPWLTIGLAVLGIALGASALVGVGIRAAVGMLSRNGTADVR